MAQVFQPHRAIYVIARGAKHPEHTEYRVAWGFEDWGTPVPVTKVQMVYKGKVAGMLAPSYPDGTPDEETVIVALQLLKDGVGTVDKNTKIVAILKTQEDDKTFDEIVTEAEDEVFSFTTGLLEFRGISPVVSTDYIDKVELGDSKFVLTFQVNIG